MLVVRRETHSLAFYSTFHFTHSLIYNFCVRVAVRFTL